jgi:hypothetical protein
MKASRKKLGPVLVQAIEPQIEFAEYPRITPGEYPAYCRFAKKYWDRSYRRWTCILRWDVLSNDLLMVVATIPCWLPLETREKAGASRKGKYLKEWVRANGGLPARRDLLSPRVFVRRMARVKVGDTDPKKSPVPYSVVRKILTWETGGVGVNQSTSHTVKASIKAMRT